MNVRRSIAVAAVALAAPTLSSCGFDVPTVQQYNPTVGVYSKESAVDVLHALVVSDTDGSGTLVATLVNNDLSEPDRLVSVTGTGEGEAIEVSVGGDTVVPPEGLVKLSADESGLVTLTGDVVVPGNFVTLTFAFEGAESVELNVPIEDYSDDGPFASVPLP